MSLHSAVLSVSQEPTSWVSDATKETVTKQNTFIQKKGGKQKKTL